MNLREKYILRMIMNGEVISADDISSKLNVHPRTIRNDLEEINQYIREKLNRELAPVGDNFQLQLTAGERELLESGIEKNDYYKEKLSAKERQLIILYDLCSEPGYITIQQVADTYFISRGTVNTDLVSIKKWCRKNGVDLVTQKGRGLHVNAAEQQRRSCLVKIIRDYCAIASYGSAITNPDNYSQWFTDIDINAIQETVIFFESMYSVQLSDVSFEGVVLHIAMAIKRFRNNDKIVYDKRSDGIKKDSVSYKMAEGIIREINKKFELAMPEGEVNYVALHIGNINAEDINTKDLAFLDYVVLDLIADVSKSVSINMRHDSRLYDGLMHHLSACVYRRRNNMQLLNPLKGEMLQHYPVVINAIRESIHRHQRQNILLETDDEIAYIALHFAASIARNENSSKDNAKVVIVCTTGVGTAELVTTTIQKNFNVNIISTIALHQLKTFLKKNKCDLVISTVPVKCQIESVQVHPILKKEDYTKLSEKLQSLGFDDSPPSVQTEKVSTTAINAVKIINEHSSPSDENELQEKLLEYLKQHNTTKPIGEPIMLYELLSEKNMKLNVKAKDWKEAVQAAGNLLIDDGAITQEYIDGVKQNMIEMGPYFVITKGVALPHTTNEVGVKRLGMSFIRLADPINFGNKDNDPVRFVFFLATTDATSHLTALQDLVEFLSRQEFMRLIASTNSTKTIAHYLKDQSLQNRKEGV